MREAIFIAFSVFTILMGAGVVFSRNPVYSAFSLVLSFFGLAALYVLWNATFIAMIQILVYTGAIVVLFVFVVMLLNLGSSMGPDAYGWPTLMVSGAATWALCLMLLRLLNQAAVAVQTREFHSALGLRKISMMLFSEYLWPFEVLSLFLLTLIISIFVLARPESGEEHL